MECWIVYAQETLEEESKVLALFLSYKYVEEFVFLLREDDYYNVKTEKEKCEIVIKSGYLT